jgi:hypothetical protein
VTTIVKRSKFNVDTSKKGKLKRTYEGVLYDSELELKYYKEVVLVGLANGSIKSFKRQVTYELQPKCKYMRLNILAINYKADFVLTYADDSVVVIDVKGQADSTAEIKKKMFHYRYPSIDYKWYGFSAMDGGWLEYSIIKKARSLRSKIKKSKQVK